MGDATIDHAKPFSHRDVSLYSHIYPDTALCNDLYQLVKAKHIEYKRQTSQALNQKSSNAYQTSNHSFVFEHFPPPNQSTLITPSNPSTQSLIMSGNNTSNGAQKPQGQGQSGQGQQSSTTGSSLHTAGSAALQQQLGTYYLYLNNTSGSSQGSNNQGK